jgi:hypothetical protein
VAVAQGNPWRQLRWLSCHVVLHPPGTPPAELAQRSCAAVLTSTPLDLLTTLDAGEGSDVRALPRESISEPLQLVEIVGLTVALVRFELHHHLSAECAGSLYRAGGPRCVDVCVGAAIPHEKRRR